MINREWLHPDILWYRKLLDRMKEERKDGGEDAREADSGC
jgi:hypothetical protein